MLTGFRYRQNEVDSRRMKERIKTWLSLLFWGCVLGLTTLTPRFARGQETPADRAYHQAERRQQQMYQNYWRSIASSGCWMIVRAKINVTVGLKSGGYSRSVAREIVARQLSAQDGYDGSLVEQLMLANGVTKKMMVDSITEEIYRNPHPRDGISGDLDPATKRFEAQIDRKACNTKSITFGSQ